MILSNQRCGTGQNPVLLPAHEVFIQYPFLNPVGGRCPTKMWGILIFGATDDLCWRRYVDGGLGCVIKIG